MSYCSNVKQVAIGALEKMAIFSAADNCLVVRIRCRNCNRLYEEELESAKAKVICDARFLCISCDDMADEVVKPGRMSLQGALSMWRLM